MKIDFTGKTALVTGSSRGIGLQIAQDIATCGGQVIITSTGRVSADDILAKIGKSAVHMVVDFTDRSSTQEFLGRLGALPKLDVCINNAGIGDHKPYDQVTEEDWERTNAVNLKAPFLVCQVAASIMKRQHYGRIVNISSIWGHISREKRSVYSSTKFGLRGLSVTYALELAQHNVLVNVVSPGFTLTDMVRKNYTEAELADVRSQVPVGRLAEPSDISRAVLFLASDLNSYITAQSLVVDGGFCSA